MRIFKFSVHNFILLPLKNKILIISFALLMGMITYLSIPIYSYIQGGYFLNFVSAFGTIALFSVAYLLMLIAVIFWEYPSEIPRKSETKAFIAFFLLFFTICILYMLSYFPGIMSSDSFDQWKQMETFHFNDWHPVFSTLYNWAVTRIWHSPAAVALLNSLIFSLVFASMTVYLKSLGVDRRILYTIALVFALNPVNGIMAVTLWKDIPYSVSLLWLTLLLMKIFYSDGRWLDTNKAVLIGSLVFTALIRHNGMAPVLLIMAGLFILYRKHWKSIGIIALAAMSLIMLIKGPVYGAMHVEPISPFQTLVNPIMQVGGIIAGNGVLTEDEKKVVTQILPIKGWKEGYKKYSEVPLAGTIGFNADYFRTNKSEFLNTWAKMALRNPKLAFKAYLDRTAIIWRITNPKDNTIMTNRRNIEENTLGFTMNSKLSQVKVLMDKILNLFNNNRVMCLTWKPATYMLLLLLFGFAAIYKNGYKAILILLPVIGNTLGLLMITTSDHPRYYYSTLIVAPFIIALSFYKAKKSSNELKFLRS